MTPKETTHKDPSPRTRRCIASYETLPEEALIRFVADPEGEVVADLAHKLPGRGMWVKADRELVTKAATKGLFARAAKAPVKAAPDLADRLQGQLMERVRSGLGLAAKAGALVVGFEKVREALRVKGLAVLVEASDGAADGRDKVFALAHGLGARPLILGCFEGEELGLALGRSNVIHAALTTGPMADRLRVDVDRLSGFCPLVPADWRVPGASDGASDEAQDEDGLQSDAAK